MQHKQLDVPHSEDCLYLNLWAPEGSGPFPIFVWIHGGGFTDGHAFEPMYDGTDFAREGIISISSSIASASLASWTTNHSSAGNTQEPRTTDCMI